MTGPKKEVKVKIIRFVVLAVAIATPFAGSWEKDIMKAMTTAIGTSNSSIDVVAEKDGLVVTILDPYLSRKGRKKTIFPAKSIRIASGILDAAGKDPFITPALEVKGKKVLARMINYGKVTGVPVVEHIWGIGLFDAGEGVVRGESPGFLVLDPNNPWVSYKVKRSGKPDLNTLVIGIVMYPDGTIVPLKSLGLGKLLQGKHPELAKSNK